MYYKFAGEDGVLANDGHIYDLKHFDQEVLQINTSAACTISVIGDNSAYSQFGRYPISEGVDQCIYWPPFKARKIFEFDPVTRQKPPSLVGPDDTHTTCNFFLRYVTV